MSIQSELDGLNEYILAMSKGDTKYIPYRLIIAVGIAYIEHPTTIQSDALSSNLGFLSKYIASIRPDAEKEPDGKRRMTIILAFDPLFNEKLYGQSLTRLQYDIERINKQIMNPRAYWNREFDSAALIQRIGSFYPKQSSMVYIVGNGWTTMLCVNKALKSSYEMNSPVNSAKARIGKTLKEVAATCVPTAGSDYEILANFCKQHKFQEIGIFNCAYEDERTEDYSIRKNKYFDNTCELLNIAYTSGAHAFLMDVTMGSYQHPNSQLIINRRNPNLSPDQGFYGVRLKPYEQRTAFLKIFPLNEKTRFKVGYQTGNYEGGKTNRKTRKNRRLTRRWRKH